MIDLDKIIEEHDVAYDIRGGMHDWIVKSMMKEAVRQALELAYERAEIECDDSECMVDLKKESIMSVLDEIE